MKHTGVGLSAALALLSACSAPLEPPPARGWLLSPCASAPNCVSSEAPDDEHHVDPLPLQGNPATAMARLVEVISAMPRTKIVRANPDYVDAEFTSLIFRDVDIVQCRVDKNAGVIQIRSASIEGYYDFGANRRRVEAIRGALAAAERSGK